MKKIFGVVLAGVLLAGCQSNSKDETNVNVVFKDELAVISEMGEAKGKSLVDEILPENIQGIFDELSEFAAFESSEVKLGEVTQGAGSDGNGGRIFCCKLPVDVKFSGSKSAIEKFVSYFEELDNVVSFAEFDIEAIEDDKYEVTALINFLGKAAGGSLVSGKKEYTVKRNEIPVSTEDEISFRDFDVSMVLRPSNSDSSAISLGVTAEKDYRVYSDENVKKDVYITFSKENNKYYCEYRIGENELKKAQIKPNGDILFDILSCDIEDESDEISTDLYITNSSGKKVSVAIFNDADKRVSVVEKSANVEVEY